MRRAFSRLFDNGTHLKYPARELATLFYFKIYVLIERTITRHSNPRGCASHSPVASQNQLGRVKAICDLARLASGVYCTIIIISNTSLINFYSFHCVIKRGFLEIRCLCMCTEIHTLDETTFIHTRVPYKIYDA